MSEPMSEARAVIASMEFVGEPGRLTQTEYVRKDIFDAYRKAVDAWDSWLDGSLDGHDVACLIKAARKAGECVE